MRNLKLFSIIGLIMYPILFIFTIYISIILFNTLGSHDNYNFLHLICFVLILYAIFHAIYACIQGYKNRNISLIITSIISCVIFGVYLIMFIITLIIDYDTGYTKQEQFMGVLLIFIPFAIILFIITLVISTKMLRKIKQKL
jgi:hypothetical protein